MTGDCITALPAGSSELTLVELLSPELVFEFDFVSVIVPVPVPVPEAVSVPVPDAESDVAVVCPAVFKLVAEAASVVASEDCAVCVADAADAVLVVLN